jgi:hypothetical protein
LNFAVSVTDCDAFRVAGVVNPLTEKPVPAAATPEIFTAAFPEFVRTICLVVLLPEATVPKLALVGLAASWPTAVFAVPLKPIDRLEFEASLLTDIEPVSAPATVGLKVAVNVAVCDAFNVAGVAKPLTEKPVPVAAMLEILTAAFPEFVNTICLVVLLPVTTVPKLTLVGFAVRCPVAVVEPVPLSGTVTVGWLGSLLVISRFPLALPTAVGEKLSATWAD